MFNFYNMKYINKKINQTSFQHARPTSDGVLQIICVILWKRLTLPGRMQRQTASQWAPDLPFWTRQQN